MKDKKAAKLIIKRAKKHPELYSEKEVYYAKMIKKQIKQEEKESKKNEWRIYRKGILGWWSAWWVIWGVS